MTAATRAGPQVRSDKSISTENSPVPFKINSNSAVVRASVDANPDVYIYRRYGGVCGAGNMTQSGYRPENADYIEKLTKVINGRRIGRDPFTISLDTLAAAGHGPRRTSQIVAAFGDVPLVDGIRRHKDLRRQCHACAENLAEVRRCAVIDCPIWPYRGGRVAKTHDAGVELPAADVLGDLPWWLLSRAVDLPDRVTEEHLTGVQRSGLVVEVQRVDAGQVGCQHLDGGVVVLSIQQAAGVEPGPGHFAVGADGDVVSLAIVRVYQGAHFAAVDVDLIDAVADHAAGEQTALLVDGQAVNALERRGGDNLFGCGVVGG